MPSADLNGLIDLITKHDTAFTMHARARWARIVENEIGPWLEQQLRVTQHPEVTRLEVIDSRGRVYGGRYASGGVEVHIQDDGRTVKVFAGVGTGEQHDPYRGPYERLQRTLASPPPGWFTLGTHAGQDTPLEFWGQGDDGLPLWERPAPVEVTGA